jgi:hypothetical protein
MEKRRRILIFMGAAFAGVQPGFYSLESFLRFAVLADGQSQ